jgi:hypothetical protein
MGSGIENFRFNYNWRFRPVKGFGCNIVLLEFDGEMLQNGSPHRRRGRTERLYIEFVCYFRNCLRSRKYPIGGIFQSRRVKIRARCYIPNIGE